MTRKHFEALAAMVASIRGPGCGPEWLAHRIADICAEDNPRFDREKFLAACGPLDAPRP